MKTIKHFTFDHNHKLGEGSTGTVYMGTDHRTGQPVAVKAIDLKEINNEVTQYLLKNEVKALQITNHPYVLKAIDVIQEPQHVYVVTDFLPQGTLAEYIEKKGTIPEEEALVIFKQLVEGYDHIYDLKIYHRDLKPHNILFDVNFQPVLSDFGYCEITGFLKKPGMKYNVGSPGYMAPESIVGNMYSQNSEVWSLGTILYEMMTGKNYTNGRPIMEAVMMIKKQGPYYPENASDFTRMLIKECMRLKPEERMKVKQLKKLLEDHFNSKPKTNVLPPSAPSNGNQLQPTIQNLQPHVWVAGQTSLHPVNNQQLHPQPDVHLTPNNFPLIPGAIPATLHTLSSLSSSQQLASNHVLNQHPLPQNIPFIVNPAHVVPQDHYHILPSIGSSGCIPSISTSQLPSPSITPHIQQIIQHQAVFPHTASAIMVPQVQVLPPPTTPQVNNVIRNIDPRKFVSTNYLTANNEFHPETQILAPPIQIPFQPGNQDSLKPSTSMSNKSNRSRRSNRSTRSKASRRSNRKMEEEFGPDTAPFYMPNLDDSMTNGYPMANINPFGTQVSNLPNADPSHTQQHVFHQVPQAPTIHFQIPQGETLLQASMQQLPQQAPFQQPYQPQVYNFQQQMPSQIYNPSMVPIVPIVPIVPNVPLVPVQMALGFGGSNFSQARISQLSNASLTSSMMLNSRQIGQLFQNQGNLMGAGMISPGVDTIITPTYGQNNPFMMQHPVPNLMSSQFANTITARESPYFIR